MGQTRVRMSLIAIGVLSAGLILGCGNEADSISLDDAALGATEEASSDDDEFSPAPPRSTPEPLVDGLPDELVLHVDYVVNQVESEGIEESGLVTTPHTLTLQKETTVQDIDWRIWGPEEAIGVGNVIGMWCYPACTGNFLPVRVTLCDIQDGEFTRFTVEGTVPSPEENISHLTGVLIGTGGEYDPDNDVGCIEMTAESLETEEENHP